MDDDVGGELDRLDESDRLDRWSEGIGFVELPIRLVEIQAQACGDSDSACGKPWESHRSAGSPEWRLVLAYAYACTHICVHTYACDARAHARKIIIFV